MKIKIFLALNLLVLSPLVYADNPALVSLDPSQVKINILNGDGLLKTNDSAKEPNYLGVQNGNLVTSLTAVDDGGPFCMFGLGLKSSRHIPKVLQVTKIRQGTPSGGLISLAVYTEGDYLVLCTMNSAHYTFRKDEINKTMTGFLSFEVK